MEKKLTYIGSVLTNECDSNRHMNVMYYVNKFELANRSLSFDLGLTRSFFESKGIGFAVLEQNIKYRGEVFEDDLLEIYSIVDSYTDKVIKMRHEMYERVSGKLSATMEVIAVLFDMQKRKSVPIPQEIISNLELLVSD